MTHDLPPLGPGAPTPPIALTGDPAAVTSDNVSVREKARSKPKPSNSGGRDRWAGPGPPRFRKIKNQKYAAPAIAPNKYFGCRSRRRRESSEFFSDVSRR